MCTVSMIGDFYNDKWRYWPPLTPASQPPVFITQPEITRAEFEQLKRDVEDMKELLKRAKKYDEDNGEPDCEIDEKMQKLRAIAKIVGVDLDDVLGKKA